jgi:integrase
MTMQDTENSTAYKRLPWNKGKLTGAKPPLRPKHVWSIRTKLQVEGRTRDLAMFNLAIDSKLRGCDVVALKVDDVAPNGYSVDRATVRQKKTGQPVRFELTEQTRQAVDDYIKVAGKKSGESLFVGRRGQGRCMSTRQYARLVSAWIASIGLDPNLFGTHSLRRTKATLIYRRTGNLRAVQLLLGHTKIESTVRYLGIEVDDALCDSGTGRRLKYLGRADMLCPCVHGRNGAKSAAVGCGVVLLTSAIPRKRRAAIKMGPVVTGPGCVKSRRDVIDSL